MRTTVDGFLPPLEVNDCACPPLQWIVDPALDCCLAPRLILPVRCRLLPHYSQKHQYSVSLRDAKFRIDSGSYRSHSVASRSGLDSRCEVHVKELRKVHITKIRVREITLIFGEF